MLNVDMLGVVMLVVVMLCVVMLGVVMLGVLAPRLKLNSHLPVRGRSRRRSGFSSTLATDLVQVYKTFTIAPGK
jgi:hypothetical protein